MLIKMRRSVLLIGFITCLLYISSCLEPISAAEATSINNGTTISYNTDCTAAYRMYAKTIRITVTDNSSYPMLGYLEVKNGDNWVNKTTTGQLVPYIVNVTSWTAGPENSPLAGINQSSSLITEKWNVENLKFDVAGEAYFDVERLNTELSFNYTYHVPNRINSSNIDDITATWIYKWDKLTGVMLKSSVSIINHNDSALDGMINTTLSETTLWGLSTEGIPGFPAGIISTISLITVGILYLNLRKRQIIREAQ